MEKFGYYELIAPDGGLLDRCWGKLDEEKNRFKKTDKEGSELGETVNLNHLQSWNEAKPEED